MTRFPLIRRAMVVQRGLWQNLGITAGVLVAATGLRWALSEFIPNLTFVSYYPAVLVITLATGWRWGLGSAVVSALVAEWLFSAENLPAPSGNAVASVLAFLFSAAIIVMTGNTLRRVVRELEHSHQVADFLNQELQHRVGNTLTVVQAVALQTLRHSGAEGFPDAFSGRVRALAKAHKMMGNRRENRCELAALVYEACNPFCDDTNFSVSGPGCRLPAESCAPVMLALHELATNATKHGALSSPEGRIDVTWTIDEQDILNLLWTESGGPVVKKPQRRGMGTGLLRPQAGISQVSLAYHPSGVTCEMVIEDVERN